MKATDAVQPPTRSGRRRPVAAVVLVLLVLLTLCGPWLAPENPLVGVGVPFAPADGAHLLGTDHLGADVLSRVLAGGRTLVLLSVVILLAAYLLGTAAGMLAAFRGGWAATLTMRMADVLMGLPPLVLIAVIATGTGPGVTGVAISVVAVMLPDITRVVRAATVQILAHDYVEVAVARGESTAAVLFREVLPNLVLTLAADASVRFAGAAYAVATAGFLGLGAQPPTPDWGLMIMENQGGLSLQPLAVLAPAAMLLVLLLAAGRLADSLGFAERARRRGFRTAVRKPAPGRAAPTGPGAAPDTVAAVRGLRLRVAESGRETVRGIDLTVSQGTVVALIGDSGSGKTSTALALLGHTAPGLERVAGTAHLFGIALDGLSRRELARHRARTVGYVAQDPRTSLPMNLRVAEQITEQLRAAGVPAPERRPRAEEALRRVALPYDAAFLARRPFQLSGGQLQRLAMAVALARDPRLLVLDEPTSALDPENTARLLVEVVELCRKAGTAVLLISHDLAAVARSADTVVMVREGRVVRTGPAAEVLVETGPTGRGPAEPGTTSVDEEKVGPVEPVPGLLAAEPAGAARLSVAGLTVERPGAGQVLAGVELTVPAGGRLCVVGPSGSGKSTLLRSMAGLVEPTGGQVALAGEVLAASVGERTALQRRRLQLVPQNPYDSLNPRHTVARIVGRPMRQFALVPPDRVAEETLDLVRRIGLTESHLSCRPAALSGGERQRVALARALAARPDVLLCDEITSALDRSTALAVLEVLDRISRELGVALVVVTHDHLVVEQLGGELAEVAQGRLVHTVVTGPA
ncbi:hypothetical protein GCM10010430_60980 [Kitasatospora cystarginea]|uniref:ABC transporter ATP-binding protein n=1 Tax=Kitasatospora cystarginea TaxID=58350 RepID=A0ABN3EQR3_9ACTN